MPYPPKKRFIIKVGYTCNNRCLFCHTSSQEHLGNLATDEVRRRVRQAATAGADGVLFSGGEPGIRKDLPQLVEDARGLGLGVGLISNGRMLSYPPLLKKLVRRGLEYAYLSLHGPEAVHDALTRAPGSFAQSLTALRLLSRVPGIQLTANAVVVRPNLAHLRQLVALLAPLPGVVVKFTYVEPRGGALDDDALLPHPVEAAAAIADAVDFGLERGLPLSRFGVDGLPHCLDPRFAALQDDMFTHGIVALREVNEETFFPIDYANMDKPEVCRGCGLGDGCRATWTLTRERFGSDYLQPVPGGRANSFNYFPGDSGLAPGDPRRVDVADGGKTRAYHTDTADFSPAELAAIRDDLGQVYYQVDDSLHVNDFPAQLRKLRPGRAVGAPFEPVAGDLFTTAEQPVRRLLAGLSGTVLDVGCGQTRYGELLWDKLAAGTVQYTGVDPLPGAVVRELAAAGKITLHATGIESAPMAREQFDWVLVMRSHNHLADLWTAYARMLAGLKWGGRLLVVDNTAFGLVRPQVTPAAIRALPPGEGLEHLRNHTDEQAAAFLARFPLALVERHPVGPATANQWLLLYKKSWPAGVHGRDNYPI